VPFNCAPFNCVACNRAGRLGRSSRRGAAELPGRRSTDPSGKTFIRPSARAAARFRGPTDRPGSPGERAAHVQPRHLPVDRLQAADGATVLNAHVRESQGVRKLGFGGSSPQRPDVALNGMTLSPGHRRTLEVKSTSPAAITCIEQRTAPVARKLQLQPELPPKSQPQPEPEPESDQEVASAASSSQTTHSGSPHTAAPDDSLARRYKIALEEIRALKMAETLAATRIEALEGQLHEAQLEQGTTTHALAFAEQERLHSEAMRSMQAELQEAQAARDIEQARNAVLTEQVEELIISQATALNQAEEAVSARDASIEELERVLRSHRTPHEYRQALQRATELVATTAVASELVHQ
jgi:hypothetical protein